MRSTPVIHEINGPFDDAFVAHPWARLFAGPLNWMQRSQYRKASGLITVTDGLANWVRGKVGPAAPPLAVISNGANTKLFNPEATTEAILPKRYVAFAGGLTVWHGVETMLAAAAAPDWPDDMGLVVIGDGPEMPKIAAAASSNPRVVSLGRLPYQEVPGILVGACAGLVPITNPSGRSSIGGLAPLKLYEVLACGVPAVVTNFPGQADFVSENRCGLVIPDGDPVALARAVAELADDPERARAMGRAGCEAVRSRHSWDMMAAATDQFLSQHMAT